MTPPHRCPTDIIETTEAEIDIIDKQYRKNLLDEARKRSLVKRDKFKQKAHRAQTRKDILKELQKRPLAAAERLELETNLHLIDRFPQYWNDSSKIIPHPFPWKKFIDEKQVVRQLSYEIDVEMSCCIIEITNHFDAQTLIKKKRAQLARFLNIDGQYDYINPYNKKVILYAPSLKEDIKELERQGVIVVRDQAQLDQVITNYSK